MSALLSVDSITAAVLLIIVIVLLAVVFSFLASAGTGTQEAFQLLTTLA
jgi:hypothetical protein